MKRDGQRRQPGPGQELRDQARPRPGGHDLRGGRDQRGVVEERRAATAEAERLARPEAEQAGVAQGAKEC